jgi:hypothetical protein
MGEVKIDSYDAVWNSTFAITLEYHDITPIMIEDDYCRGAVVAPGHLVSASIRTRTPTVGSSEMLFAAKFKAKRTR